jgi:ribose-phosphate pyrophosphokinase
MKILNLTNLEKSDIKYEISRFPDGQKNTVIDLKTIPNINQEIQILTRLNNFIDLEILICITKCLNNLGFNKLHLYNPMMLGSRSDRKFEEGSNNYLKDVICPIINSLKFESVTVLDPHSDVLEACLNNFKKVDNKKLVEFGLSQIYYNEPYKDISIRNNFKDFILISPDAGANKKIFKVAETIDYKGDIITCSKSRDVDGKLTKLEIPVSTIVHKDYILIDDICDGGATFLQIAKTLKPRLHSSNRIFLIVTHGIFSKGFKELNQYFDGIYCTNSYRDVADDEYGEKTNVKQLKVI